MSYMWVTCSFSYYMIVFYAKYLPGNIYNNSFANSGSELLGTAISGYLYSKFGMKITFSSLLLTSAIGGVCIIILGS